MNKTGVMLTMLMAALLAGCAGQDARPENDPKRKLAETQVRLGIGYMQQGKMDLALNNLRKALEVAPDMAAAHNAMAILYTQLGEHEKADSHYGTAVSLDPKDSSARNNYGTFLCGQKRYREAYEQFEKAVGNPLYSTPALAYENAGLCAMNEQNHTYAADRFRKALDINPGLSMSLLRMAEISYNTEHFLKGRAYLQRYEDVAPHNAESLLLGARIEKKLGAPELAEQYAQKLRAQFPDSPQAKSLGAATE